MRLFVDMAELPDDVPLILSGVISKGSENKLFAWHGGGRDQVHVPCEVIISTQNAALSEEPPQEDD